MGEQKDKDRQSGNRETYCAISYFSQIGVTLAATVLIGVLLGKSLDDLFGTAPWLLLIFSLLGVGAAIKSIFRMPQDKE